MEKRTLGELEFEGEILDHLEKEDHYVRRTNKDFDRARAMDDEMLLDFLEATQPDEVATLRRVFPDRYEETVLNCVNRELMKPNRSLIDVLKNGVDVSHVHLHLMYRRPASGLNPVLEAKYEQNKLSVAKEVWVSDEERIDLVIFLNGLALFAIELKCEADGQDYTDAMNQWRQERNPKDRALLDRAGCAVFFAMDTSNVYMTTRLAKERTAFLPFNMGKADGSDDVDTGAGNPVRDDGDFSVAYMWEDVLKRDSVIELVSQFMFYERDKEGHETLIFPRYHQRDAVRSILADAYINGCSENYLVQHSAGSGKTKTIVWLAYRLASLHDANDKQVFDNVIIMTDRVNVDRQLQAAVLALDPKAGMVKTLDASCTSADLADALNGNTKITVTTIQKFMYIADLIKRSVKTYAVIIDEAHSSTAGTEMASVRSSLMIDPGEMTTEQDVIDAELRANGKLPNVSMFAFTATPKPTTLQLFGRPDEHGFHRAFHLYSMKQAIEEGFILDVLANYTEYETYFQLTKTVANDPRVKQSDARRRILRFAELQDANVAQRVEIIVEHFRENVMATLDGQAKAMVVTGSRKEAVRYTQAFQRYIEERGYDDVRALVAFSGKVTVDGTTYTEPMMNGFPESQTPVRFDTDEYNVMLVADKYQTGYDQPKLCAMYVMKRLRGVNAVQTLSRLNRVPRGHKDKQTFVLDFVNSYDDMRDAFAPYYKATMLANTVTVSDIWELDKRIDAAAVFDPDDIDAASSILLDPDGVDAKGKRKLDNVLKRALRRYMALATDKDKREFAKDLRAFVRFYEFLAQASGFSDEGLYRKHVTYKVFARYIPRTARDTGLDLSALIAAMGFKQRKVGEHKGEKLTSKPFVKLPTADRFVPEDEDEVELSKVIADINSAMGTDYDTGTALAAVMQVVNLMMASDKLKRSAKANTKEEFRLAYDSEIKDAMIRSYSQNKEFFNTLLKDDERAKEVFDVFLGSMYRQMRGDE